MQKTYNFLWLLPASFIPFEISAIIFTLIYKNASQNWKFAIEIILAILLTCLVFTALSVRRLGMRQQLRGLRAGTLALIILALALTAFRFYLSHTNTTRDDMNVDVCDALCQNL